MVQCRRNIKAVKTFTNSSCLSVVLVGVFLTYYGRVAAFLVGLLFSFVNEHLEELVEMVSFPPSIFGLRFLYYMR